ncbi:ion channel [Alkalispirillum mobile]|uniref:Ion channel n=1 Tax=Alkalispirillum mobile TaxID=85925 RepID=A0A498BZ60_9GAMM|nr:NAD-binding protein [Alkalispirillum mobile]RLK48213.1 ion channel [Alkalispirillum mobile]
MHTVIALILRRMRWPLLLVITAYSIATLGLVLIPGVDDQGDPWRMDFLHAFYFVTYTAPTIGFGEVPYEFTPAQRLWALVAIYLTVITWFYALVTIIALVQDRQFRETVTQARFSRTVRHLRDPFYLVCGYGDTGHLLVRSLTERGLRAVVLDIQEERINLLGTRDLISHVPGLRADARQPETLINAGLQHACCVGVLAVTDDDQANLQVAINSKLLNPALPVTCRAETEEAAGNMASFGTDHIINPFEAFGDRLAMAIRSPRMHQAYEWLSSMPGTALMERPRPPQGTWIICGYGRLGRAVHRFLDDSGVPTVVVDETPEENGCPDGSIRGKGTEAHTLDQAGVKSAAAVLAATADDADNLSVIMTARDLNPDLYLGARNNQLSNKPVFRAANLELPVEPSYIIATRILSLINAPLLPDFLRLARKQEPGWHEQLVGEMRRVSGESVPEIWTVRLDAVCCPALLLALREGLVKRLGHLLRDPGDRDAPLAALPLLLARSDEVYLHPGEEAVIEPDDQILFCGTERARHQLEASVNNINTLRYLGTGELRPDGWLWRRLARQSTMRMPEEYKK